MVKKRWKGVFFIYFVIERVILWKKYSLQLLLENLILKNILQHKFFFQSLVL